MRLKSLPVDVDPAERWLGERFLGETFSSMPPEEGSRTLKAALRSTIARRFESEGFASLPIDPIRFAEAFSGLHFEVVERLVSEDHVGILAPRPRGFSIVVNPNLSSHRRRFTLAHEVGHSFFYDWMTNVPTLRFRSSRYWVQEGYASEIARDILLPERLVVRQREATSSPSLESLRSLSKCFDVSADVLRRRLVEDLRLWDCVLFQSRPSNGEIATLTSDISKGPSYRAIRVPRKISLTQDHLRGAVPTLLRESIVSGRSGRIVTSAGKRLEAESARFGRDESAPIFTLVR